MSMDGNLWSERKKAAMRIRAKILAAIRSWFKKHDYVEVQGPIIIPAIGNWSNYVEVKYPGRKAYLGRGLQPYANILMMNIGKIYAISPAFRPAKVDSWRHLVEYWQIEAEIPQRDLNFIIRTQEQLLSHVCQSLSKEAREELEIVQRDIKDLRKIHPPFPRLTYDDAIKLLQEEGFDVQWGTTLDWEHEKHLSLRFGQPFFISKFPIGIETFFFQQHPQKPEATLSVDLFAPEGYGEISTGGQPVFRKVELQRKMKEEQIGSTEQEWYMQLKEEIPYSGFAIGLERLIQWICKLEHIKEASAFPRLLGDIYP
jgi:asparaginyl-tRNA synthetase